MAMANCGGFIIDGSTLKMVNGVITVSDGSPTNAIVANCNGIKFDATYFKKIGNVITDKKANSVSAMIANCGGLLLDANVFKYDDDELTFDAISSEADVKSFKIGTATGAISGTNISVEVAHGTDVTALKPTIVISNDATISPKSGVAKDFTNAVTYTVTAEDGTTTKTYTVTVTVADEAEK